MAERDNPARYLPIIESRLARIESGTNISNSYNANTRKTNSKKLSDYIQRTQKSKKAGRLATERMAKATELATRMKRLFRNDEEASITSETQHIDTTLSSFTNYPPISYVSPPSPEEPADSLSFVLDTPNETQQKRCSTLFDPCTKEPLANLSELEKRVRELKQHEVEEIDERIELPANIKTRLDLLVFVLNQPTSPTLSLLEYKRGGQTGQIFEAYWDIVFALGLVSSYPINNEFYMYNGNIDGIRSMDDNKLINNPLMYLQKRNVNMGASGASDITIVYKATKEDVISDPCSHTTFTNEKKPKFIFCSSKFYRNDAQKGIDKFDLQNIYTSAKNLSTDYDYDIILLVKNRKIVKDKIKSAIRQYIAEEASNVFGVDDLLHALNRIYSYVHDKKETTSNITNDDLFAILGKEKPMKPILNLRLHQEIAVQKISKAIHNFNKHAGNNKFLVGILPRGGKTYIAGGIVREIKPKRVVVLLGAMSETLDQFKADLFEYFQDFNEYTIVNVKKETVDFTIDESKKYIFIMSIELYKQEHSSRRLLHDLKSGTSKADLFLCDEAHLKQVTARADIEMKKGTEVDDVHALLEVDAIISKAVPIVYMTGTYMRPLTAFQIPHENVVIWDYQDLQNGKKLTDNDTYFRELYKELYTNALEKLFSYGETMESISNVYKKFPDLHLLTTQFTDEAKHAFSDQGLGKGFATIEQLFRLKKGFSVKSCSCPHNKRKDCKCSLDITTSHEWANGFQNLKGVLRLINYLSPPSSHIKYNDDDDKPVGSVIRSIDKISQRMGDRLAHISTDFVVHTQIWFMAHSQSDLVENRMPALASAIFRNKWFRDNFVILGVYGKSDQIKQNHIKIKSIDEPGSYGTFIYLKQHTKGSGVIESLKESIIREEEDARKSNKGLLILAQNMLQVGISLPCADVVVLLDTGENVDERIQKMFRALTESPMKKAGFIVDMNYFRTVKAIMDYQITSLKVKKNKRILTSQDKADEFNKFLDLYAIDDDKGVFKADIQATIPEIETLIQREGVGDIKLDDAGKHIDVNVKNILDAQYSKMYNDYFAKIEIEKEQARVLRREGRDVKEADNENSDTENILNNSKPVVPTIFDATLTENGKKEAFLDIFKTILKMGIFTTNKPTIDELQTFIKDNTNFRDVVYDTLVKRGDIIVPLTEEQITEQKAFLFTEIIIPNLQKIVASGRGDSYIAMKSQFDRSDDMNQKIDEVLTYINTHLAPKDKERHQHGEVFTPLSLVDEMLSKLPEDVWSNPDLKWLDPANGMGNFPIKAYLGQNEGEFRYPGLYEGLKKKIPDEKERCKHIIENMLFMIDINGKNNAIARKLFEKLCPGTTPNIEQIDKKDGFLSGKPLAFNDKRVEMFDVIIGNPPYNRGGISRPDTRKDKKKVVIASDKKETIWNKFIEKSFTLLKPNGFLLFINPIGWFHPGEYDNVRKQLLNNQIHDIKIYKHDSQAAKEFSGSGKITVAYFLVQNTLSYTSTNIMGTAGNIESIRLYPNSIILLNESSIINKIVNKSSLWKDNKNFKHKSVPCEPGTHPQIAGIYESGIITVAKTLKEHEDAKKPKIIISGRNYPRIYYDKKGEYGLVGSTINYWIGDKPTLDKIHSLLETKLAAFLTKELKFRQDFVEFKYFPDVMDSEVSVINDKTLADLFDFTAEEQKAINAVEYPKREYTFKEIPCGELKVKPIHRKTRKVRRT